MTFLAAAMALTQAALSPTAYTDKTTGETAHVKRFTIAEREKYNKMVTETKDKTLINQKAFMAICCDADGKLLFDDIAVVAKLPDDIIYDALEAFNKQKPETIEQAEKN